MALHPDFLRLPLAHRGLHDATRGTVENSSTAFQAAIAHGYGIELDLQLSADAVPVVFHDHCLERLTKEKGAVAMRTRKQLSEIVLSGGSDTVPSLSEVLALINGRVPLLVELKDRDGRLSPGDNALPAAVAKVLTGYKGPLAVMSFNPFSMGAFVKFAPDIPSGLVVSAFTSQNWPLIDKETRSELAAVSQFETAQASFVSCKLSELRSSRIMELRAKGIPVLCWTVSSAGQEAVARQAADNITFEGFLPGHDVG